ncbi:MAG: HD domain-containing phosphohydrolase [Halothermotrichaceae bacterium]
MTLYIKLKKLRKEKELTQKELAEILNCSRTTIANYEQGNRVPDIYFLKEIADFFQVSLDYLMDRENYMKNRIPFFTQNKGPAVVLIESSSGEIIDANKSAVNLYGYSKEDLLQMTVWDITTFNKNELLKRLPLITKGIKRRSYMQHRTADGTIINVEVLCSTINNNNKTYIYCIIYNIDNRFFLDDTIDQLHNSLITRLMQNLCNTIPHIKRHLERVALLSIIIAEELDLSPVKIKNIKTAAKLHDIGLISIPKNIVTKPDKINTQEYELIKKHPEEGYKLLKNFNIDSPIPEIVLQHHERIDGSGYPNGLKNEEIKIEAKIIGTADILEAETADRPYREKNKIKTVLNELKQNQGIIYDKKIVDIIFDLFLNKNFRFP